MAEQTDVHGWTIPTPDEDQDWGVILNALIDDDLDREVIVYGQSHERPSSGADGPHLFFDVDNERFDFNDGTDWNDGVVSPASASYVTADDETSTLSNSEQHADLSGGELHAPSSHASTHGENGDDELSHNDLSLSADDHHAKYTDSEAVSAVESTPLDLSEHLDIGTNKLITDGVHYANETIELRSVSTWAVHNEEDAGTDLLTVGEGGSVGVPNGDLSEQGDRVATRTWVNNNAGGDIETADSGTTVASDTSSINFANNLDVTDDGSGAVTVDASGGGTFSGSHDDLDDVSSGDHHTKTTDASDLTDVSADSVSDAHHAQYTDSDAESAINNDGDHGSTASHDYTQASDIDSTNWDDLEIQVDGTDGQGIINFKTT